MTEKERQELRGEIRRLLETKIKKPSEFEWCELAEEILDDVLESVTMRLGELREEHEDGGD